jgi:putative copper export protein
MYRTILLLHILGATIWTGGHLILALRILPRAVRARSAALLLDFEQRFEPLGLTALVTQVGTGIWLGSRLVPFPMWFALNFPASQMLVAKLTFLVLTIIFALDARLRVLPRLRDDNVGTMVPHIVAVTTLSVLFVAAGVGIRTGGWF